MERTHMHKGQRIRGTDTYTLKERIEGRNPIYRVCAQESGKDVVVNGYETKEGFLRESAITKRVHHPCVLPLVDTALDASGECTLFPYIYSEDLTSFIRREGPIGGKHFLGILPAPCDAL